MGRTRRPIRRSVMDVLMTLPPEVRVLPGHTEETTIGREWEENPFVTYWRGESESIEEAVRVGGERGHARRLVARLRRQGQGDGALRGTGARRSSAVRASNDELPRRRTDRGVRGGIGTRRRPSPLLAELAGETLATMSTPQMLAGPVQGRFFELLVHATGAKRDPRDRHLHRLLDALDGGCAARGRSHRHARDRARNAEVAQRILRPKSARLQDHLTSVPRSRRSRSSRASSTSSSSTRTRRARTPTTRPFFPGCPPAA